MVMKITNGTPVEVHWNTTVHYSGGKSGGDCGNIAPDSEYDYPVSENAVSVDISLSVPIISYKDLIDGDNVDVKAFLSRPRPE